MLMLSPSSRSEMQIAIASVVIALTMPLAAQAECVTVRLPKGERYTGPVAKPTLIFSGTVTGTNRDKYTVSFDVNRVWRGHLRRETILFVVPLVEGTQATFFKTGSAYLVAVYLPLHVFSEEDAATTGTVAGTLGVMFGCGDEPVLLANASESLKRLGRGKPPRP
jgi:hypothetical protein